ncbi:hypothetical protein [Pseudonocardia sp. GCM10023141]|uniref:hypothetical protein n=1 Tax=Pseudonocardia sp. GCM10023141 TaxID=3252653 RepID=UPI00361AF927
MLLGASVPPQALLDAAGRLEPTVIFLWAHSRHTARQDELATLRRHPSLEHTTLVLGGPGWPQRTGGQLLDLAAAVLACTSPILSQRHGSPAQSHLASQYDSSRS